MFEKASILPEKDGCPYLMLAPMEGVGDRAFRRAMASVGGFDEAVREFIRVPLNAHVKSLASVYEVHELDPFPLVPQIMGSEPELMAAMAKELVDRGAKRIDVNCGCPSNTVTGRNAGSSLLKDPALLNRVVKAVVQGVTVPVTVKMRSGYEDISLFQENILSAQESGVSFITLHPRTKVDGYGPPARWDLIAKAKSLLCIPLVGNGDILTVSNAVEMKNTTHCDALMIGRGSIINPFIFLQIRAHYRGEEHVTTWEDITDFLDVFLFELSSMYPKNLCVNKLKQLLGFMFKANVELLDKRQMVLRTTFSEPSSLLDFAKPLLKHFHTSREKNIRQSVVIENYFAP